MQRIQGSQFQQMCADIAASLNINTASFATVTEFLQTAGQGSVVSQVRLENLFFFLFWRGLGSKWLINLQKD